jgi:hypothetical protein
MAKIPDSTYLGERRIGDGRVPLVVDRSAQIAAQGASDTATSINNAVQRYAEHDDAFNYARARSAVQSADIKLRSSFEDDADWATQESRYSEGMKTAREEASKLISGARSRALFDNDAKVDVERGTEQIRHQAKETEGHWGRAQLDDTLASNRTAALEARDEPTRAALTTNVQDSIAGALQKRYITPEQAKNLTQTWASSYGEGFVEVQPTDSQKLKLLRDPKKNPAQFIEPDKRQEMIRIIESRMQVQTDRREAAAERAFNQAERQISGGVPLTKQGWVDLERTVAGTPVAKDFHDLVASEKEVQQILRTPLANQQRVLQEREAKLLTDGGDLKDAANYQRLERAVKQNMALIQNAPLVYGEQRLGDTNEPIDVTSIVDPAQQKQTAAVLQERATRIRGLQKTLGAGVPMKPLLPQEAGQLVTTLQAASPKQASEIFASLSQASGSPDVFKGAMAQIAPDAPVKAFAGMLASNQRELVTGSKWFAPDPFLKSNDVAATLLRGDRLLNPSKGDKAEDGKPKTSRLLLPNEAQAQLQTLFADEVGDAFAGRSEDADRALQAVQAYYVGRADQTGRLAEDAQTVDTNLVREAVRATLGNVVNYNDHGKVLAPWGMTEDDFEDRVGRKFSSEAKRLGLPDSIAQLGLFGLVNANREGLYGIQTGGKLLLDGKGNPVTIDIRTGSAADARGYIDRSGK